MRIVIAGLGGAARRAHIPAIDALAPRATLVAAADPDPLSCQRLAEAHPEVPTFASAQEMLSAVACDVLVVAADPSAHPELVTLGLRHGRHVVCEKPLTLTRSDHVQITAVSARRPDLALVPVHQYRYSTHWVAMARWIRAAIITRRRYRLTIDIHRPGTDPHATSPWRADLTKSGGMLADNGVHFLALAWHVHPQLDLIRASRDIDREGHEHSTSTHQLGPGTLTIRTRIGAPARTTHLVLRFGTLATTWHDDLARVQIGHHTIRQRRVDALSDRAYVDSLYRPLYCDVLKRLSGDNWRTYRTRETLAVSDTLLTLLERTPVSR